ncbi:hypothetical protein BCh11DRAFT_06094 [Burkholderia sp. Ch1-1]|nr:hypothetical protein BCh11DRAFT_06094 [Burkholderia sp. Ch1-1]
MTETNEDDAPTPDTTPDKAPGYNQFPCFRTNFRNIAGIFLMENVFVTTRAVEQRLKRSLAREGLTLRISRGERNFNELGRYYVVNVNTNGLQGNGFNLEDMARKAGVLKDFEKISEQ